MTVKKSQGKDITFMKSNVSHQLSHGIKAFIKAKV